MCGAVDGAMMTREAAGGGGDAGSGGDRSGRSDGADGGNGGIGKGRNGVYGVQCWRTRHGASLLRVYSHSNKHMRLLQAASAW